jgi:hypothetical protein
MPPTRRAKIRTIRRSRTTPSETIMLGLGVDERSGITIFGDSPRDAVGKQARWQQPRHRHRTCRSRRRTGSGDAPSPDRFLS